MIEHSPKKEYRVLQVFSTLGVGGAETWLMALLRYFDRVKDDLPYRIKFDICLTSGNKGVFDEEAAALGAGLFYVRYSRGNLPEFVREFRAILRNGNYDAIHDHQDYAAGLHFLFGLGLLPPVRVVHVHNPLLHLNRYYKSLLRRFTGETGKMLLTHLATHILGTSRQILDEYGLNGKPFQKVRRDAVHCGFDVDKFSGAYDTSHDEICAEFGWDKSVRIMLFVGRLFSGVNHKNPGFAIEVARICVQNDPRVRMLMAGSGEEMRKELQSRVRDWGLQDYLLIIGNRDDVPRLMSGSDLLIFPSIGEGLGMVAVEAQAAGLRVLASDAVPRECMVVPGMVEFMDLEAGPSAWASRALSIMNLPLSDALICNSMVRDSQFSIENSAANLLEMYMGADNYVNRTPKNDTYT